MTRKARRTHKSLRPLIVTFYSFKGGVGRTLALVNVAFDLAARGKNVVLIDFDLEAPGLDAFPNLRPNVPVPGLLEYVDSYISAGSMPDLTRFVTKVYEAPGEGTIWTMYAGRFDDTYPERLGKIDWSHLYAKLDGYEFFEKMKTAISEKYSPHYVLIDSRTGQADVAGIATIHLPDVVVLMYALDEQNLRGSARMADVIRNNRVERAIKIIPVACRVPSSPNYLELQASRLEEAKLRGISPKVVLPSESSLAFRETILTRAPNQSPGPGTSSPLRLKVEELTNHIIRANVDDVDNLLEEARSALAHGNPERVFELYSDAFRSSPSSKTWLEFGTFLLTTGKHNDAVEALNFAQELDPDWPEPIIKLGHVALSLRNTQEAIAHGKKYLKLGGQNHEDVLGLGTGLFRLGETEAAESFLRWCHRFGQPDEVRTSDDFILVLIARGHLNEALTILSNTFEKEPQLKRNVVWLYNYAETLRRLKRAEAQAAFEKLVQLAETKGEPEYVLFESEGKRAGIKVAVKGSFDANANYSQALGHAYAQIGQKEKATVRMRRAIELARQNPKEPIFSTVSYKWEKPESFISQTIELLKEEVGVQEVDIGTLFENGSKMSSDP